MNWISSKRIRRRVKKLFEIMLLRAGTDEGGAARSFFPLAPDSEANSYFKNRVKTTMSKGDFETADFGECDALERCLAEMWTEKGFDELAELAGKFAALSKELYEDVEVEEEISPFVYVMF